MGFFSAPSHRRSSHAELTEWQREKEYSLARAILLDLGIYACLVVVALVSGSLTILAEVPRGGLLLAIEIISLITLRRSHRGLFSQYEYGIGKIEQVITVLIVIGLFAAALWTFEATISRIKHPEVLPTPAMIMGVVIASTNLAINTYCFGDFARNNAKESSIILAAQVKSRLVKTLSSAVVVVVLVIATWLADPTGATYVDAVGAVFVGIYMITTGIALLRESLPDLLDRALPEHEQLLLMKVMTQNFDDFDHFGSIKSRRSGGHAFIDLVLEFPPEMPLAEVNRRCTRIHDDIVGYIPDALVSVVPEVRKPA